MDLFYAIQALSSRKEGLVICLTAATSRDRNGILPLINGRYSVWREVTLPAY